MFRGINPINLDAKGRAALPAKYRGRVTDRCDGHMVLTVPPFDRCLLLYPLADWEVIEAQVNALPNSTSRQARRLQHLKLLYEMLQQKLTLKCIKMHLVRFHYLQEHFLLHLLLCAWQFRLAY